jgi:hypothetical protein
MAYEQKDNTGSLFKNDRKEQDTHADYRGSALIGGVEYWVDAWINTSSSGAKYMSLRYKLKNGVANPGRGSDYQSHNPPAPADLDDEVPF